MCSLVDVDGEAFERVVEAMFTRVLRVHSSVISIAQYLSNHVSCHVLMTSTRDVSSAIMLLPEF